MPSEDYDVPIQRLERLERELQNIQEVIRGSRLHGTDGLQVDVRQLRKELDVVLLARPEQAQDLQRVVEFVEVWEGRSKQVKALAIGLGVNGVLSLGSLGTIISLVTGGV